MTGEKEKRLVIVAIERLEILERKLEKAEEFRNEEIERFERRKDLMIKI